MRLTCPNCGAVYDLPADRMPPGGTHVQCGACHTRWFARGETPPPAVRPSEDEIVARLEARAARPRLVAETPAPSRPAMAAPPPPIVFPALDRSTPPPDPEPDPDPEADLAPPTPLRPRLAAERPEGAGATGAARPAQRSGGGASIAGFAFALVVAAAALGTYLRAEEIAARVPAVAGALEGYVATVDEGRAWLERGVGSLRDRLVQAVNG